MSRYINTDALEVVGFTDQKDSFSDGVQWLLEYIDTLPPVDAVEVVRCENCKYFDSGTYEDGKLFFKCIGWVYGEITKNDFCSHGVRKDG